MIFTDKQLEALRELQLVVNKYSLLPLFKTMTPDRYDQLTMQAAQLMITAALDIKKLKLQESLSNPALKEDQIEEEMWTVRRKKDFCFCSSFSCIDILSL